MNLLKAAEKNLGFSLVEALIALAVGGAFLTSALGAWVLSSTIWKEESMQNTLRFHVEKSMEKMKEDAHLSDANNILFYPQNAATYTAVSVPRRTLDGNGLAAFSGGSIAWNRTVIYHIYNNAGRYELRRTVFNSFDSNTANRQAQLDNVVSNGGDAGATTSALFSADSASLSIVPQDATFDGYGPSVSRGENTTFGSVRLTAGNHQIRFEVTGKNSASSGYQLGLDSLALAPSGGSQETEALLPAFASSGQSIVTEDMTPYVSSTWGGNYQVEYQAGAVGNYITFQTYYDQWLETNFSNMTHSFTTVSGTNPSITISSRETQELSPAWQADAQTLSGTVASDPVTNDKSIRTVIVAGYITKSANMIRIKLTAGGGSPLNIGAAYFGVRQGSEALANGTADFSGAPLLLYFDDAPVIEGGADPPGSVGTGAITAVTVPAGYHVWSNWFQYNIDTSTTVPDFLVSLYIPAAGGSATTWTPPGSPTYQYRVDGNNATASGWSALPGYTTSSNVYAAALVSAWIATGTSTSQVYDTKLTTPAYGQISWVSTLPAGSSVSLKVRSSGNPDMSGAPNWSVLPSYTTSPSGLGGLANLRYVQFQANFQAAPPYTSFPQLDNVSITWPGQTSLVELSGYCTKRPNYGIFKVLVDGSPLIKGLEFKLSTSDTFRGKTFTFWLNSEEKSRNTGK